MQPTTGYKLIKKIKDEKFEEENLHAYTLLVQYSNRDLQVGITDENDKLLFFEDFVFNESESNEVLLELLKDLFNNHALLTAGFWKGVVLSVKNNQFVQVPSVLFEEKSSAKYLAFNADSSSNDTVLWCPSFDGESITVFA
ncbi:MAG: DUF3822 family protein [Flammeovirgaceae bacterium]|nr:DUF3822 family protein [Flammeovirgaceae bacterium]